MNDLVKLAQYGSAGVAIALIIAFTYIVCKLVPLFIQSLNANTKATIEMYEFLKNLNGKIKEAIRKKTK